MKKLLQSIVLSTLTLGVFAQQSDQLPSNPEDGKCYAKCIEPDEYKEEVEKLW